MVQKLLTATHQNKFSFTCNCDKYITVVQQNVCLNVLIQLLNVYIDLKKKKFYAFISLQEK